MAPIAVLTAVTAISACKKEGDKAESVETAPAAEAVASPLETARASTALFKPLPETFASAEQTEAQEDLGRKLYYDVRMSKNHDISCNSCHNLESYGVDGEPTSPGHKGVRGARNSPTVYNAAGHVKQFWDGRAADVEEQAKGPVLNPVEMAMPDEQHVVNVLESIPGYVEEFEAAFPESEEPVTYDNFAVAVGAFERNLVTPSRWDAFLAGKDDALTEKELKGFNLFMQNGCAACHNGELLGGKTFQKVGSVKEWPNQDDLGRFVETKEETDRMVFKTPSLRNVAKTAPYFHDGSVADLSEAVKMMSRHQLGKELSDEDTALIVAWLETLTGEIDQEYIAKPELPESGPQTPAPDNT
jgi:cytochrome c peroxidase